VRLFRPANGVAAAGRDSSLREQDRRGGDGFLVFGGGARREGVGAQRGGWRCFVRRLVQEAAPVGRRGGLINDGVFTAAESDEVSCHAPSLEPIRREAQDSRVSAWARIAA